MKTLFIFLFTISTAFALPVLDENRASGGGLVTIWPDHQDKNRFYFAPNELLMSEDERGRLNFSYKEYQVGRCFLWVDRARGYCHTKALVSTIFSPVYLKEEVEKSFQELKKKNPKASLLPISFQKSKLIFPSSLNSRLVDEHDCDPITGQMGDEVPCQMTLNFRGIRVLKDLLMEGRVIPLTYEYQIRGVVHSDEGFKEKVMNFGIATKLGDTRLMNHPDF